MSGFLTSTWQIALSAIMPVAISVIFLVADAHLHRAADECDGVIDLTSLSILFGLFAALLVSDVWQGQRRRAGSPRGAAVRPIAHARGAGGIEPLLFPGSKAYIAAASAEDPYSRESAPGEAPPTSPTMGC
jgi:hypothetical protein